MKRPRAIAWFERLMLVTVVFATIQIVWMSLAQQYPQSAPLWIRLIVPVSAMMLVTLGTFLVSRLRSRFAAVFLIGQFVVFGVSGLVRTIGYIGYGSNWPVWLLYLSQGVFQVVAYILLVTPASRAWFRRADRKPDLASTFS